MATKKTIKKSPKNKAFTDKVPAGSRKSLDSMSDSHRKHVEFWAPHKESLKASFVWAAARRFHERGGEGLFYVMVKRGGKDYAIVSYDTSKMTPITKKNVLDEGFETSSAGLETFKDYRSMAKEERAASREKASPSKPSKPKRVAKPKASAAASKATAAAKSKTKKSGPPRRKASPKRAG